MFSKKLYDYVSWLLLFILLLLDDAFQHRNVKAGYSILLMDYNKPFYKDCMLPAGDLREYTSGKKRADRLIVTKCPVDLSVETKKNICLKTGFLDAHVYFSNIVYGNVLNFDSKPFPDPSIPGFTAEKKPKLLDFKAR
mgnify:CR=1 FL=1